VQPGIAEVAFAVIDKFQGKGIGSLLMRHLTRVARNAGLKEFIAEVLPGNAEMLSVFGKSGLKSSTKREAGSVSVRLELG
jgi:GNAT superfamily N-acetyltransferase